MRLAAIDIGTNSVHMIVVRVRPDFSFEIIDREKEMVRLGAGGLDGKKLTPEAMSAALQALKKFARLAESHQVDEVLAVATSATREAENGGAFLRAIERRTGIRARIITGTEEARLIHLAAVYGVDTPKPAVVIDIGGGSVEITLGGKAEVEFARSFKIGVIRLTERFVDSDPISSRDERKMTKFIREQVDRYLEHIVERGYDRVIGTSGTILSLGTVATAVDRGSVPQEVRNLRVPAKSIRRLRKTAVEMDLEERMRLPGLDPRRADLMVAGGVLLDTLLKDLGAEEITLCDLALREGVLLDYIHQHRRHIARIDRYPDVRRRSVIELAERCAWEADHARQVAAIALTLFDSTKRMHELGDREREWLEYAGFLHDIGNHISYEKHHRHSYYLIKHGDLRGFEPEEIDVIALLTRYHRRATPKPEHIGFEHLGKKQRRTIAILAAFLRLAETLDRSKHGVIRGLEARERLGDVRIKVQAAGDAELEVWAAHKQTGALEEALERKVLLEKVPYRKASAPSVALVNNSAAMLNDSTAVNGELIERRKKPRVSAPMRANRRR
ncbi:MAG TPA: Ppx/GppA phosphatase family protein [Vicinamibacterales bacterium]|nr:Ppx/GppA phosphatase family protein [Vicinamibacterales bacterium]